MSGNNIIKPGSFKDLDILGLTFTQTLYKDLAWGTHALLRQRINLQVFTRWLQILFLEH